MEHPIDMEDGGPQGNDGYDDVAVADGVIQQAHKEVGEVAESVYHQPRPHPFCVPAGAAEVVEDLQVPGGPVLVEQIAVPVGPQENGHQQRGHKKPGQKGDKIGPIEVKAVLGQPPLQGHGQPGCKPHIGRAHQVSGKDPAEAALVKLPCPLFQDSVHKKALLLF